MESCKLMGESTMFVHQEAEPPLFLKQNILTAICNKLLHVHLAVCEGLQTLLRKKIKLIGCLTSLVCFLGFH